MRRLLIPLLLAPLAFGQSKRLDPIKWKLEFQPASVRPGGVAIGKLTAAIEPPWHLYSPTTPKGGPIVTTLSLTPNDAIEAVEVFRPKPDRKFDQNFNLETETYEKEAIFFFKVKLKPGAPAQPVELTANTRYQACTDKQCLPPVRRAASATLAPDAAAPAPSFELPPGYAPITGGVSASGATGAGKPPSSPSPTPQTSGDLAQFALLAFGLGLAAVFTPCVFPMIPFTVTYFLNRQSASRADSILQAGVFSAGIVLLFTSLGFVTTALLGPFGVVQLGSNPWVNGFIAIVFAAFSLSMLGAFEITLPSGLLTRMDRASQSKGGVVGSLLMGLTFSLTSFACVGPFVGSLLAASVQGGKLQPAIGMLAFSSGLASPFFLLAMFPSTLSSLPRSGAWLPRVKTVLGFVLLAASLKYVSNIDQVLQWNFLTRDRFLAAWVVLFALPGLYLLGLLRMEGIKPDQNMGVGRTLAASAFLMFSISLLPGMFCGKLGELDAYVPLAGEGCAAPGGTAAGGEQLVWMKNQYKEALAKARAEHKLLFINFTGYACTNCHWMKANMFPRPEIMDEMRKFVLVELYTDGTDAESERNQELQNSRFSTIAIPYYVLIDPDEKVIAAFPGLTKKSEEFLAFLKSGRQAEAKSAASL